MSAPPVAAAFSCAPPKPTGKTICPECDYPCNTDERGRRAWHRVRRVNKSGMHLAEVCPGSYEPTEIDANQGDPS